MYVTVIIKSLPLIQGENREELTKILPGSNRPKMCNTIVLCTIVIYKNYTLEQCF